RQVHRGAGHRVRLRRLRCRARRRDLHDPRTLRRARRVEHGAIRGLDLQFDGRDDPARHGSGSVGTSVKATHGAERPEVSVVIPVYNEARILEESLTELVEGLRAEGGSFEIVLAENGSRDGTVAVAEALMPTMPELRVFSYPHPNYGAAL